MPVAPVKALLSRILRGLGPALPFPPLPETLRAALGAGLGLMLANAVLERYAPGSRSAVLIIAPFGASAFLIFVVPSSPLAQPWPVVVGNSVSALMALLVLMLPLPGVMQLGLAVALGTLALCGRRWYAGKSDLSRPTRRCTTA